jgi:hypothetical protein
MFWTVQRGSASAVVSTGIAVSRAADRSVVAARLGEDADGSDERMASTAAATRYGQAAYDEPGEAGSQHLMRVRSASARRFLPPPFRKRSGLDLGGRGGRPSAYLERRREAVTPHRLLTDGIREEDDKGGN